jgi:hypothetical protein
MKKILFMALIFFSTQVSAKQWLCITDHMTGFYLNEQTHAWEPATFTDKPKYLVTSYQDRGKILYKVKQLGSDTEFAKCQDYQNKQGDYFINCDNKFGSAFIFNQTINRFQFSNVVGGYVYPYLKDNVPFMVIGLCSLL